MRRLVLVLVATAAVYFLWQRWGSNPVEAAGDEALTSAGGAAQAPPAQASLTAPGPAEASTPRPVGSEASKRIVEAVSKKDPEAMAAGYRRLLDVQGAEADQLAQALTTAAGEDPATMLTALGDGNAFLHSAAGRDAARRLVKAAAGLPADQAAGVFTGLLERAMRGSIEKADTDAVALVDEIWAAYQGPLNRTVFNPENVAGARTHQVQPGESLDRIAAAFRKTGIKVDAFTLAAFNRISDPTKLRQKQLLKVPAQPIKTVVEKRSFLMAMYLGDVIFRLYWVGHGKDDRTPETTFKIGLKQEKPDWHFDGRVIPYGHPENILGAYFVKFEHASYQGYGAHGTPEPESVGTMASRGCLRMRDDDIRDFFRVVPRDSEVLVRATNNPGSR